MLESVSTVSRHYPQEGGARFAKGSGRFTGMRCMTLRIRFLTWKLRALIWVLRRQRAVDYRSIYREKEKQLETIPKKRLRRIGIRNDISLTIKPSSIIIPIAPTVLLRRPPRL